MSTHPPASQHPGMSTLVAIAYPDEATAEEVVATLGRLQKEHAIELEDAVIITPRRRRQGQAAPDPKLVAGGAAAARCGAA